MIAGPAPPRTRPRRGDGHFPSPRRRAAPWRTNPKSAQLDVDMRMRRTRVSLDGADAPDPK